MHGLSDTRLAELLRPYLQETPERLQAVPGLYGQLSEYLRLLLQWNAVTNLTSIRKPEEIVQRHFGESLFAAGVLARYAGAGASVLDFGSGAGFPGVPAALLLPEINVTLAESQGKKAAFLRELVRVLDLRAEIWAGRVERMPSTRRFDAVLMRAVDRMEQMEMNGWERVAHNGILLRLTTKPSGLGTTYPLPGASLGIVEVQGPRKD